MELDAVQPARSVSSNAATGDSDEDASATAPAGGSKTVSRWLIQHVCSDGSPASSRPVLGDRERGAAELADRRALDAAAQLERHRLHPVTDAEHRDPELEQLRTQLGRALAVDRRRTAGEDQPARRAPLDLLERRVVRQQLGEHAALAHPPRDQLRVLAPEVEDENLVVLSARTLRAAQRFR